MKSIIALLTGIIVPAVSSARESARRVVCQSNLRSVGQAIQAYMQEFHEYYPPMAPFPTIEEETNPVNPRPPMNWVDESRTVYMDPILTPYVGGEKGVFECPSDQITDPGSGLSPPGGVETYYVWQGSSYEPRTGLSVVSDGYWLLSRENSVLGEDNEELKDLFANASKVVLLQEYEPFHVSDGTSGVGGQALYADFHVAAMGSDGQ